MTNNVAEQGRMLAMLEKAGLITLDPKVKRLKPLRKTLRKPEKPDIQKIAPELTAKAYNEEEGDAVFINVNYAIQNKLNPLKDAIQVESTKNNPYANIIAVRKGDEKSEKMKALMEVLHSKKIKDFIEKNTTEPCFPYLNKTKTPDESSGVFRVLIGELSIIKRKVNLLEGMAVAQYQDNGKSVHDALKQYKEGLGIFEQKCR